MKQRIFIWDNDGTIMGSKDPNDASNSAKIIMPNVERTMKQENVFNIICSGCKTPDSELQNFDAEKIIKKFKHLMTELPISLATFSPAIGGIECWVVIKHSLDTFEIRKAHEDVRYKQYIGQFKKPGIGMFVVIKDILEDMNINLDKNAVMIGDTWHDKQAATDFGISFLDAREIHNSKD